MVHLPREFGVRIAAALIAFAAFLAYADSFSGAFVFDDPTSIAGNPTIRSLWPPWAPLMPPHAAVTVQGRPVLNLSLALNYAVGGTSVTGYHVVNLAIHIVAALALFGIVRRTLRGPRLRERFDGVAVPVAFSAALLWAVHPLQTEAISYIIQRAESLMGMFYLLTLYAFVRGAESAAPARWHAAAIGACALGMATKEVMVSAPLLVLLLDRTYFAGGFRAAWQQRRGLYVGLASTWALLILLVAGTGGNRGGAAGFDVGVGWWEYALTQFPAIVHYLWLTLWPQPLVFEYGTFWIAHAATIIPAAVLVLGLGIAAVVALARNSRANVPAVFFFCILAVTSLVPGTTQMIVEHRMYLPLATLAVLGATGLTILLGPRTAGAAIALAAAFALLTTRRNLDYRSDTGLWADTVAKRPLNALAHEMYGLALDRAGARDAAVAHYETALELYPKSAVAHDSLGQDLLRQGHVAEAIAHYEAALRIDPGFADSENNLGTALALSGRLPEALPHFEAALRLKPDFAEAQYNFGNALSAAGRDPEAIAHFEQALRLRPDYFEAQYNLANALASVGRRPEAIRHYEAAIRLRPGHSGAQYNLGNTLAELGRLPEAIEHFQAAVRLAPDFFDARCNLGTALLQQGRRPEAIEQFEAALRLKPDAADVRATLARLRAP